MTGAPVLETIDLHAYYGRAHILSGVSIAVPRDAVVTLIGRNGAGKSTTIKSVMGLVPAASGTIRFEGRDITTRPTHEIARAGIGYVPEDRRIFTDLTVMENLAVGRREPRPGVPAWTPERLFEIFPNLAEMRRRRGGRMSGGEQQMLTIARALMGNPSCILLDEPSEGLAPVIVEQMCKAILRLKTEGLSVLLSEQNLHFATLVSDRAYIIETGRIRYGGTMTELLNDEALKHRYLSV